MQPPQKAHPDAAAARPGVMVSRSFSCSSCIGVVAFDVAPSLLDCDRPELSFRGIGAGMEYCRRICRADFVRSLGLLRRRCLHLDDLADTVRSVAVDRNLARGDYCSSFRFGPRSDLRASTRTVLHPFDLGFAEVVRIVALNWASLTGGPEGLSIPPVPSLAGMVFASKSTYAALMLGYLVAVYCITKALEASRFGYYLFAIRDNEDAAGAAGVNPLLGRAAAMALGVRRSRGLAGRCSRSTSFISIRPT